MAYKNKVGNIISNDDFAKLKKPLQARYEKTTEKVPTKKKVDKPGEVEK